jgi:predicted ATPase/DNA-binding CsgD family transcriptional regulator
VLRVVEDSTAPSGTGTLRRPPGNLPLELSSFVGRGREIAEIKRLLEDSRLLTLVGPGGCGKTRLALAVASEVAQDFEDGRWWVELAPLADPDLVPQAVASSLGVREAPGRTPVEVLIEHLRPEKVLLVLDNCEHLIDTCATLVDNLLRACRDLKILATSREALGIAGERAWVVPSLSLPDIERLPSVEELPRYEAVRLFDERARAVTSTFELKRENAPVVAQLCQRLEGVPLAIELAAARTKVLSVGQILVRLEDSLKLLAGTDRTAPERQRTLRGALDWSYELLGEQERKLFGRLSVFAGGWTLEAAEAVGTGEGIEEEDVLDLLSHLVDKSLVLAEASPGVETLHATSLRYRMLEPVRQYAQERLEESGEAEQVRERHARHYLALAEEAEPVLREQQAWLERLGREHANFRAALSWALDEHPAQQTQEEDAELGLRLAAALAQGRFWNAYGPSEGRRWLERGLARSSASPTSVRAKALREAGWIAIFQGDYEQAVTLLEEGMALFKELEDRPGVTTSLVNLGLLALHGGDLGRAKTLSREAEALRRELADPQATGFLLIFLGMVALDEGDHDRAVTLLEESLTLNQDLGDVRGVAMCLTFLGTTVLERGDAERAAALYEEDMRLLRGLRDKTGTAYGLRGLAGVATSRGEPARAGRLWGAEEALREAAGLSLSPFERSHPDYEGYQAAARSQLDEAAWEAAWSEGRAMTPEEAIEYALKTEEPAPPKDDKAGLSERELEILRLVAQGLTDSQVAERLYLSPRTVGQHLRSIYRKLGVPSRAAAAKEAAERSLI